MGNKKSLLTLVLEAYQSSCCSLARRKKPADPGITEVGIIGFTTSLMAEIGCETQVCWFHNILGDADFAPDQLAEVERTLREVENHYKDNEKVMDSVRHIRAELPTTAAF